MEVGIVYSDRFLSHAHEGHPESPERLSAAIKALKRSKFAERLQFIEPKEMVNEEVIGHVHSDYMIGQVRNLCSSGGGWIDIDTYVSKDSFDIAKLAIGGTLDAAKSVIEGKLDRAFCAVRPPGHHATKHLSMGFCLFNNAAIAANELSKMGHKVLIYDQDVHHGNGTQEIFYDRDDVLYMSTHAWPYYPGTGQVDQTGEGKGEGFTINAPLPRGTDNEMVRMVLDEVMIPVAKQFRPDIILFSAGYDSHYSDPLGVFKFTTGFFHEFTEKFLDVQSKAVAILEGGYDVSSMPEGVVAQVAALCDNGMSFKEESHPPSYALAEGKRIVKEMKRHLGDRWDL